MSKKLLAVFFVLLLSCSSWAITKVANDPTRISVGARPLGMGKAYLGQADDINSMFLNPAGLANIENWQATSMSGKFINEVSYLNLGGAFPTRFGNFAIGYIGSNLSFFSAIPTLETIDGGETIIVPSTTEGSNYRYNNNVTLLSYARPIKGLFNWKLFDTASFGTTLKLFSQQLAGAGISGGIGTGYDIDFGFQFKPRRFLKTALVVENALPARLGGKIRWDSQTEESLPSRLKVGFALNLLGAKALRRSSHELTLGLDADLSPLRPQIPTLLHLGLEWSPQPLIDLRAGIDQDVVGKSTGAIDVASNLTAGVGLYVNGWRFDYAFHQYFGLAENDTHYFSLSYGIWKDRDQREKIIISQPKDKSIHYQPKIKITGEVTDDEIKKLTINNVEAIIDSSNMFEFKTELKPKKNSLLAIGYDNYNTEVARKSHRVLHLLTFKDVGKDFWARKAIGELATLGIINGYPDGTFRPNGPINRAEFVALLVRVKGLKPEALESQAFMPFDDVKYYYWAAPHILYATEKNLVKGYPNLTFKPKKRITRAEAVTVIARFNEFDLEQPVLELPFPDIPGRHWGIKEIYAARQGGLLGYLSGKLFEPNKYLSRGEAAEILSHTKFIKTRISQLHNWTAGY